MLHAVRMGEYDDDKPGNERMGETSSHLFGVVYVLVGLPLFENSLSDMGRDPKNHGPGHM